MPYKRSEALTAAKNEYPAAERLQWLLRTATPAAEVLRAKERAHLHGLARRRAPPPHAL